MPFWPATLNDPDDGVRRPVVEFLGDIGGACVIPHLIRATHHRDVDIAEKAAESLGRMAVKRLSNFSPTS